MLKTIRRPLLHACAVALCVAAFTAPSQAFEFSGDARLANIEGYRTSIYGTYSASVDYCDISAFYSWSAEAGQIPILQSPVADEGQLERWESRVLGENGNFYSILLSYSTYATSPYSIDVSASLVGPFTVGQTIVLPPHPRYVDMATTVTLTITADDLEAAVQGAAAGGWDDSFKNNCIP